MATWEETIQEWGGKVLDAGIAYGVTNPYEVQKLQIQALGDYGYYNEGQPGTAGAAMRQSVALPSGLLLIGGLALVVFLLKD